MALTESSFSKLQPVLDKFSIKLRSSWSIPLDAFEREFMKAIGECSGDALKGYAVDIAEQCPEYDPLIVYWIEESSAPDGPTERQKKFLAQKYDVDCWVGDKQTRIAYKDYLAKALQN